MENNFYIGSLIKQRLEERGMTKSEFARRINCSRGTVYNIFNSKTIDIVLLKKISNVLEYDFIEHYINDLE